MAFVQYHVSKHMYAHVLVLSDEPEFVQLVHATLKHKAVVYSRSKNVESVAFTNAGKLDGALALADVISLSMCTEVLKTSSALSAWVQIVNPKTKVYTVTAMKMPYFPAAAVPVYKAETEWQKKILARTMHGHTEWKCMTK